MQSFALLLQNYGNPEGGGEGEWVFNLLALHLDSELFRAVWTLGK